MYIGFSFIFWISEEVYLKLIVESLGDMPLFAFGFSTQEFYGGPSLLPLSPYTAFYHLAGGKRSRPIHNNPRRSSKE